MRSNRLVAVGAVVVLVALAGCTGALASGGADAPTPTNRTITVDASGQVTAQPDQAVVRIAVVTRGDTAELARQRLAENVSSLRSGLSEAGVSDDQVTTSGYDIGQRRVRVPNAADDQPQTEFVARQSFEVTLTDTGNVGAVIDAAAGSGATEVGGVRFTLSDDRRESLRQDALSAAMDNARRNAGTLAEQGNLSITGVGSIESVEQSVGPYYAQTAVSADAGGGTTVDSGPVTVSAHVRVTYEAE